MKQYVELHRPAQMSSPFISSKEQVILFGAGVFAPPAIHALRQRGISPCCICDNSAAKHGDNIMGLPVLPPAEALSGPSSPTFIITTAPQYIDAIRSQLAAMGQDKVYDCADLLSSFEYDRYCFASGVSALHFDLDRYFYDYFLKFHPERLIVPSLDIVITEKCSLKCRDCSNLMQYYTHPKDIAFDDLFASLDFLMICIDHVLEFRVLGGETFMNRQAHSYIERLRTYSNYTRIAVYSNGTILPRKENLQCLKDEKTYLRISNYGPQSSKIDAMVKLFDANGIVYDIQPQDRWQDCSTIVKRERTTEELKTIYTFCCANKTLTLLNGRLYICPFAANASNLGALPPFSDSIEADSSLNKEETRIRIFDMLRTGNPFSACRYCAGRSLEEFVLPAAVQASSPLPYERFGDEDA